MLDSGSLLQRLVALALCSSFAADEARPRAEAFLSDEQVGNELQIASARFLLLTLPQGEAVKLAVGMLDDEREEIREAAVASLAECESSDLGRGTRARSGRSIISYGNSDGKPIVPLPPKALKVDDVLPLLDRESNEKIRAHLGYLLALFGNDRGLDELIEYWRSHEDDDELPNLVYRAVASLNDASKTPILVEIYESLDSYEVGDFYWTIRIMSGTDVLRLRKRIRDEVGMSELQ
jgi:HEAT repeat protein